MTGLSEIRKRVAYHLTNPAVKILAIAKITPNTVSWAGFLLSLVAAYLIARGYLLTSGIIVLIASSFDILDGALARYAGKVTRFGGILDSTFDRVSEAALWLGVLVLFLTTDNYRFWPVSSNWAIVILALVMVGSPLVSYLRARAEAAGLDCQIGVFTRTERVIVFVLGLLFNQLVIALVIIAVLSFVTAGQRILFIWQKTKREPIC